MSGWIEFFELEIICPKCRKSFEALYCEDGNLRDPPEVKTFLAIGKTNCPHCKEIITEKEILNTTHTKS